MPYVVTQSCCADASCVVACPVNCIHPTPGEPGFADPAAVRAAYVDVLLSRLRRPETWLDAVEVARAAAV